MNRILAQRLAIAALAMLSLPTFAKDGVSGGDGVSGKGTTGFDDNPPLYEDKLANSENLVTLTEEEIETTYGSSGSSSGGIGGTGNVDPSADALLGAWLAPNSGLLNPTVTGYVGAGGQSRIYTANEAAGSFLGNAGIVLTTGSANFPSTNTSSGYTNVTGTPGSFHVSSISSQYTYDSNSLRVSFSVAAGMGAVSTRFVFASEEYPEWTGLYHDGFAFVVDGVNYAKFDADNFVVLDGLPTSYADPDSGDNVFLNNNAAGVAPFEYDGYTSVLVATGLLDPTLSVHTIEVVIADSGDALWDSAVFLSGLRGEPSALGAGAAPVPEAQTYSLMLAGLGMMGLMVRRRQG